MIKKTPLIYKKHNSITKISDIQFGFLLLSLLEIRFKNLSRITLDETIWHFKKDVCTLKIIFSQMKQEQ